MSPAGLGLAAILASLVAVGCTHVSVWQSPDPITPSSYRSSDPRVTRMTGKLRRLAALPARALVSGEWKEVTSGDLLKVRKTLVDVKGYEVIPIELYADISGEKFDLSPERLGAALDDITAWVRTAPERQRPSPGVAEAVSRIGRGLKADGLLIVQIAIRRENIAGWVDIIEVATGQVAWRLRFEGRFLPGLRAAQDGLMRLEPAIPSAVIEE